MRAICKKYFRLGSKNKGNINFIEFLEGNWYEYWIEIHNETKTKFYYIDGHPILERTFRDNFDDLQQMRKDKLNQILND